MFFGETAINLDAKGRLAIPMRHRDLVASACENKLVLTYNAFEPDSLWLYPQKEWESVRDDLMKLSSFDPAHRAFQRRLVGSACHVEPDKGSRILLPVSLRQTANLDKKIVILGMGNKFEIWNEDALNKSRSDIPTIGENSSEAFKNLVI